MSVLILEWFGMGRGGTDGQEITALDYFLDTQEETTLWQETDEFRWILIASYFNDKKMQEEQNLRLVRVTGYDQRTKTPSLDYLQTRAIYGQRHVLIFSYFRKHFQQGCVCVKDHCRGEYYLCL